MSNSRRRFRRSEFSWLNGICMLIQVFLTDEIKFQQQDVALHAYFAYLRTRLHMHQSVNMWITIVFFFDQSRRRNESNISKWNSSGIRELQFDSLIAQLVIDDHRFIVDNIHQLIRSFNSFICWSNLINKAFSIKCERITAFWVVNNALV